MGDFFLSKGLLIALDNDQIGVLKIVSNAVKEMSEGELLQIEKSRKLDITEEVYFDIIKKKTATLITACTKAGAYSVDAGEDKLQLMSELGENLGIAFQIRDDLFDYENNTLIGKPTGNDIKEKKLTLPLIYALQNSSLSEKRKILTMVRRHNKNDKKIKEIIQFVKDKGGIEYTEKVMMGYGSRALDVLEKYPDSEAKESLKELVSYTVNRKK